MASRCNSSLDFWRSNWLGEPLVDLLQISDDRANLIQGKISDFWKEGWAIPTVFRQSYPDLYERIIQTPLGLANSDKLVWTKTKNGEATSKAIFDDYVDNSHAPA